MTFVFAPFSYSVLLFLRITSQMSTFTSNLCLRDCIWWGLGSPSCYKISPTSPFPPWPHLPLFFLGTFHSPCCPPTPQAFSHLGAFSLAALSAIMLFPHLLPSWWVLVFPLLLPQHSHTFIVSLTSYISFITLKTIWHDIYIAIYLSVLNLSLPTKHHSQDGKNIVCSVHYWIFSDQNND